jgi:hypothetical protein
MAREICLPPSRGQIGQVRGVILVRSSCALTVPHPYMNIKQDDPLCLAEAGVRIIAPSQEAQKRH